MTMPKVSVCVPIYKVEKYIERCARTLFEQTLDDIEYIFVNDCTPDKSVEVLRRVLEEYPRRKEQVRIIDHEKNQGLANARITAIKNCTGEYVLHVDSDDYVEKEMLSIMLEKALKADSDMVVCDFNYIYPNHMRRMSNKVSPNRMEYISDLLHRKTSVGVWGRLTKASLYREYDVYPIPGLNYAEDYAVTPRLAYFAQNICKIDIALYNYVQYNSASYTKNLSAASIDNAIQANVILTDFFTIHGMQEVLPLNEAMALTFITLLYSTPQQLLPKIISCCKSLDVWKLKLSLLHKILLSIAKRGNKSILCQSIKIVNFLRGVQ